MPHQLQIYKIPSSGLFFTHASEGILPPKRGGT
jgi:hypothetical protein